MTARIVFQKLLNIRQQCNPISNPETRLSVGLLVGATSRGRYVDSVVVLICGWHGLVRLGERKPSEVSRMDVNTTPAFSEHVC